MMKGSTMFDPPEQTITPEEALARMPAQVIDGLSVRSWAILEKYGRHHNILLRQFEAQKANHVGYLVYAQHKCKHKASLAIVEAAKCLRLSSMDATLGRIQDAHYAAVEALLFPGVLPRGALI